MFVLSSLLLLFFFFVVLQSASSAASKIWASQQSGVNRRSVSIFNRRQIWTAGRLRKGYTFEQVQFWIYLVWLRESPVCGLRYCIQIPQVSNITKCCRTTYHTKKKHTPWKIPQIKKKHIPGSFWQNKDNKDKLFCNFDIFFSPNVCGKSASVLQLITVVLKANG